MGRGFEIHFVCVCVCVLRASHCVTKWQFSHPLSDSRPDGGRETRQTFGDEIRPSIGVSPLLRASKQERGFVVLSFALGLPEEITVVADWWGPCPSIYL